MLRRLLISGVALLASLGLITVAAPANAYANQWAYFQTDADRCWDMAVWYSSNGRATDVSFDFNNDRNCAWDSLARDMDRNGSMDELWLDASWPGGGWDYLVVGDHMWMDQTIPTTTG